MNSNFKSEMAMILALCLANCLETIGSSLAAKIKTEDTLKRFKRHGPAGESDSKSIGCFEMTKQPGEFWYRSAGQHAPCGLYLIADANSLVQLEVTEFDVGCEDGGLLAIVDGWELQGELFPNPDEIEGGFESQYKTFCSGRRPSGIFTASQNVALVQFHIPSAGQGFRVRVRFIPNPEPCNVIAPFGADSFSLRNFGFRRNCTVQIIFPVNVRLLSADIGVVTQMGKMRRAETGLSLNCVGPSGGDYAEFMFGTGLNTDNFETRMSFCGLRKKAAPDVTLACGNSAVKLVSSGRYFNSLTFHTSTPTAADTESFLMRYPECALLSK